MDEKYNGWCNYETWCVNLWLSNEEESYNYWRDRAEELRGDCGEDAEQRLAEELESDIESANPCTECNVFADLMRSSLDSVRWDEIAESLLEDFPVEEEKEDEADEASA